MTPEKLGKAVFALLVPEISNIYDDMLDTTKSVDAIEPWKSFLVVSETLTTKQKAAISPLFKQLVIDTIATLVTSLNQGIDCEGVIEEFKIVNRNGDNVGEDFVDIFLECVEEDIS